MGGMCFDETCDECYPIDVESIGSGDGYIIFDEDYYCEFKCCNCGSGENLILEGCANGGCPGSHFFYIKNSCEEILEEDQYYLYHSDGEFILCNEADNSRVTWAEWLTLIGSNTVMYMICSNSDDCGEAFV